MVFEMTKKDLLKRSPDIETMVPYWDKVSDILDGEEAVKARGRKYLPKFPDEEETDFEFRLTVAKFTNIYRDVVEGLATKPFQDEIGLLGGEKRPQELKDFAEDVDGFGSNLTTFAALTFFNAINYGIDWIFVDYPTVRNPENVTVAEAKQKNLKPFWVHILGKNVLEVETRMEGSKQIITYFRCQEPGFGNEPMHVREFVETEDGIVWVLYEKIKNDKGEDEFIVVDQGKLSINFIPIVPFITGRRDGKSFKIYPPMRDAADLQITLYQNESALEYIKVLACYPMLATDGTKAPVDAEGKPIKLRVGPNRVIYGVQKGNGDGGTWQYVEPQANSLEFLQKNIDKTKNDLRELGRQPLTALSTQLTTVTTSIAAGKAKSAVTAWAYALKDALENALAITMKWMGIDYQPEINVYTGFDNVLDDGSDIEELGKARERGDISVETYWDELKRRKILSPEFDVEEERKRLLDDIPADTDPDIKSENEADNNLNQEKEEDK
jgi:hypothetical protein